MFFFCSFSFISISYRFLSISRFSARLKISSSLSFSLILWRQARSAASPISSSSSPSSNSPTSSHTRYCLHGKQQQTRAADPDSLKHPDPLLSFISVHLVHGRIRKLSQISRFSNYNRYLRLITLYFKGQKKTQTVDFGFSKILVLG